jgi:site-specific recombinase XerD
MSTTAKETGLVAREAAIQKAKDKLRFYLRHSKAPNTVRTYLSNWKQFEDWCGLHGIRSLPAEPSTVALYISQDADALSTSTIRLRLSAISKLHQLSGHKSPTKDPLVQSAWDGIKRSKGVFQTGKAPLLTDDIREMVSALPDTIQGVRDRALLLFGFAGCFRRSEIVGLELDDVRFVKEGMFQTVGDRRTRIG